jgi:hypothetical protein
MPRLRLIGLAPAATLRRPLAHHRLGQDGGRGGAVTGDVVGLLGDFLDELGADLLVRSSSSISLAMLTPSLVMVGHPTSSPARRCGPWAEGHLDGVGEDFHPALEAAASQFELNQYGDVSPLVPVSLIWTGSTSGARDGRGPMGAFHQLGGKRWHRNFSYKNLGPRVLIPF